MRLVAAAGHDLRTPMTRMRLRAEFLDEDEREGWLKDIDELEIIAESAINLVKEETARVDFEPVDMKAVVADVVSGLREINLPVEVLHAETAVVSGCAASLKRAVSNLVSNAARHGGEARVSVACKGNCAHVIIEDFGPGIPEDKIEMAFEPFFRVDPSRVKKTPGAGLGLSIAKTIVMKHDGEIELMNKPDGNGLIQHIRIPSAKLV
jgi:signal transduction histidine kinase